ncbi:SRPBCC domain-containing protein, partial [Sphingomonas sp. 32-62-10]|uniref:SRPBCC domain-containing protein n=1 Tax=Sphingomonas sp. 32-62-10 TaxID=1970436 RepID=UPI0035A97BBA
MDRLVEWWCPKPWSTEVIENDMRAGGRSAMIMRGPNGEESAMEGVFLEVVPGERVVFTNAFTVLEQHLVLFDCRLKHIMTAVFDGLDGCKVIDTVLLQRLKDLPSVVGKGLRDGNHTDLLRSKP